VGESTYWVLTLTSGLQKKCLNKKTQKTKKFKAWHIPDLSKERI
jgi:hypothetical protein